MDDSDRTHEYDDDVGDVMKEVLERPIGDTHEVLPDNESNDLDQVAEEISSTVSEASPDCGTATWSTGGDTSDQGEATSSVGNDLDMESNLPPLAGYESSDQNASSEPELPSQHTELPDDKIQDTEESDAVEKEAGNANDNAWAAALLKDNECVCRLTMNQNCDQTYRNFQ